MIILDSFDRRDYFELLCCDSSVMLFIIHLFWGSVELPPFFCKPIQLIL